MRLKTVALVLSCLWFAGVAVYAGGGEEGRRKLHPAFENIVAQYEQRLAKSGPAEFSYPYGLRRNDGAMSVGAIIWTDDADAIRRAGIHVNSVYERFVTAQVTAEELKILGSMDAVNSVEPGRIYHPAMDVSLAETGASLLHAGFVNSTQYKGQGVIVLIYDSGIDWKHLDFRKADGSSRILFIWDQTGTPGGGRSSPSGFSYGVEYTKAHLDDELDGSPTGFVLEADINFHGTHVAGTAVGNGRSLTKTYMGMAPEADIIVVKGGDFGFPTSRIIDGLSYAQAKAIALVKPIVVNMSLGGQLGPHDGTNDDELAVNSFSATAGRVVVIAAGNEGGDLIHRSGTISSTGSDSLFVTVPAYTPESGTNNDYVILDVWLNGNQEVTATVTSPNGVTWTRTNNQTARSPTTTDGTIDLYNYVAGQNSLRNIVMQVSDAQGTAPASGTWKLTISNPTVTANYDAWLGYATMNTTLVNGDNNKSVGMPGTSNSAITVGSYATKWGWPSSDGNNYSYGGSDRTSNISLFSGIGPTRDNRQKPDLVAPGQAVVATLSTSATPTSAYVVPGSKHVVSQGTSMATPHVAGAVALMLQANPALTAAQIKTLLTSTADSDVFTSTVPNNTWGYGKLDALEAVLKTVNSSASVVRKVFVYDLAGTNQVVTLTGTTKYAVKISPDISGRLTGIHLNLTIQSQNPISGTGPLVCEVFTNTSGSVAGIPDTKIGNTVSHPFAQLSTGTNNYIDMLGANVTLTSGTDYHIVLSVANSGDQLIIRTDDGSGSTNRSSVFNGSVWRNFSDPSSGMGAVSSANIRVRATVTNLSIPLSVSSTENQPASFSLAQNYPNPFNPSTTIEYSLAERSGVKLTIFDLLGRQVTSLFEGEQLPGDHKLEWSGRDARGRSVSSGVYFYRLETSAGYSATKLMMLLK
jgi:minor extracellular serine protease Vpr